MSFHTLQGRAFPQLREGHGWFWGPRDECSDFETGREIELGHLFIQITPEAGALVSHSVRSSNVDGKLRIVFFSDTHGQHEAFDGKHRALVGDVLVFAGDMSAYGTAGQLREFIHWFKTLHFQVKVLVAGNHDFCLEGHESEAFAKLQATKTFGRLFSNSGGCGEEDFTEETLRSEVRGTNIVYLSRDSVHVPVIFRDEANQRDVTLYLRIHGMPQSAYFHPSAFDVPRDTWDGWAASVPSGTNILVTHGPPYGKCDVGGFIPFFKSPQGDRALKRTVEDRKPFLHVFGHMHEAGGWNCDEHTMYLNAAAMRTSHDILSMQHGWNGLKSFHGAYQMMVEYYATETDERCSEENPSI